jgi:D-alanine--poly(phosphoribitol) ligase subunit 2
MTLQQSDIEAAIKCKVMEIAQTLGSDASDLQADEVIPATGYIDSAGLLELIAWFEQAYAFKIPADELTIDNLGTMTAMGRYLLRRKGLA